MFKVITEVRASERVAEQIADVPFPHNTEEVAAARLIPDERSQQHIVDILAPQLPEHVVEMVKVILQERMPQRIAEEFVDVPFPRFQRKFLR